MMSIYAGCSTRLSDCSLLSVFYDLMVMFIDLVEQQVMVIPKISAQDTILKAGNAAGETKSIPVPKGTYLRIDVPGLHYNSTQ